MNTTTYVRTPRISEYPFTRISNSIAKLPAAEAGIMLQILSNSNDWVINKEVVRKRSGLGKDRFTKAWNHLKNLGYISIKRKPSQNGKIQYDYIIYENPEVQNHPAEIETLYEDNRNTVNHITVTGSTNNYQVINEDQIITASGSNGLETEWRVRPDADITGPNILGQDNKTETELQIVPHPSLCCGEVRDDETDPIEGPKGTLSTNAKEFEPFSWEDCNSNGSKISTDEQFIIEGLQDEPTELLKEMINDEYNEKVPNWESILSTCYSIRLFFTKTEKLVKPDNFLAEVVIEYYKRIKHEHYSNK